MVLLLSGKNGSFYFLEFYSAVKPGDSKPVDSKLQALVNFLLLNKMSNHCINYMIDSKHLAIVNIFAPLKKFTKDRFHCTNVNILVPFKKLRERVSQVTIRIEEKKLWHFVAKTRFASETAAACCRKGIVARHESPKHSRVCIISKLAVKK